jgi:hypothetical protein
MWEVVDQFTRFQDLQKIVSDLDALSRHADRWRREFGKVWEIKSHKPLPEECWVLAGEEVALDPPGIYAASAHSATRSMALFIAVDVLFAQYDECDEDWKDFSAVSDAMFRKSLLTVIEDCKLPDHDTWQRLKVKLCREHVHAKTCLNSLRTVLACPAPTHGGKNPDHTEGYLGVTLDIAARIVTRASAH